MFFDDFANNMVLDTVFAVILEALWSVECYKQRRGINDLGCIQRKKMIVV